jgi:hypothetical protein
MSTKGELLVAELTNSKQTAKNANILYKEGSRSSIERERFQCQLVVVFLWQSMQTFYK